MLYKAGERKNTFFVEATRSTRPEIFSVGQVLERWGSEAWSRITDTPDQFGVSDWRTL
jgi:hypothetical protein